MLQQGLGMGNVGCLGGCRSGVQGIAAEVQVGHSDVGHGNRDFHGVVCNRVQ